MAKLRTIDEHTAGKFRSFEIDITYPVAWGDSGVEAHLASLCAQAVDAIGEGYNILILSDENVSRERVAVPVLLALSALHQHLIREGLRTNTGLIVHSGAVFETHDFALLLGYGAEAVHPYLSLALIRKAAPLAGLSPEDAVSHYVKAVGKGLTKVMAKMGICTVMSYRGARIFEAVGLNSEFVDRYFHGTPSKIEGLGLFDVMREAVKRHDAAYAKRMPIKAQLDSGGQYAWRADGEEHMWTPEAIVKLQRAARQKNYQTYKEYASIINDQSRRQMTLRGLLRFKTENCTPVPIDEVEPAKDIVKRFATGAMSMGSISAEAHATLAVAMNRIGGKSNTGEGGEDPKRYEAELKAGHSVVKKGMTVADVLGHDRIVADIELEDGDSLRSRIKQVASGRFGVTEQYLASADQIQIKMAQGAKPGEGGQLPGHKVTEYIAELRYSVPGVGLISPPPHHDIYSIEDLAQLIHDLKRAAEGRRLMVLDTLRRFHIEEENASGPMAQVIGRMEAIAADTGCSIVFLHHASKGAAMMGAGDQQQASRGSSVLVDNIRWQSYLSSMTSAEAEEWGVDDDQRRFFVRFGVSKANYGAPFADRWFRRHDGGVLKPAVLERQRKSKGVPRGEA